MLLFNNKMNTDVNKYDTNFLIVLIVLSCFSFSSSHLLLTETNIKMNNKLNNKLTKSATSKLKNLQADPIIVPTQNNNNIDQVNITSSIQPTNSAKLDSNILDPDFSIPLYPLINYKRAITTDVCNTNVCNQGKGVCSDNNTCTCVKGFANIPILTENKICDYKQRKQIVAFLLELCLACGIGHFYIGAWWLGMIKLLVIVLIPIFFCSLMICSELFAKGYQLLIILFSFTGGLYWISDVILFGLNYYRDGNGVPLEHW